MDIGLSPGNGRGSNCVWESAAGDELDWMAVEAQARDQPRVVALPLVEHAPGHHLAGDEPAGRLADADQRVVAAPKMGSIAATAWMQSLTSTFRGVLIARYSAIPLSRISFTSSERS